MSYYWQDLSWISTKDCNYATKGQFTMHYVLQRSVYTFQLVFVAHDTFMPNNKCSLANELSM